MTRCEFHKRPFHPRDTKQCGLEATYALTIDSHVERVCARHAKHRGTNVFRGTVKPLSMPTRAGGAT